MLPPPIINIIHRRQNPGGQPLLRRGQLVHHTAVMEAAHRAHHGRRPTTEHLDQAAGGQGRHNLAHRDLALGDGDAGPRGHHLDDGAAGDAGQDDAGGEGRGDQLQGARVCPQQDEEVHGSNLCDLVVLAVQPEALLAPLTLRNLQFRSCESKGSCMI
jgi:hypothetical protein